MINREQAVKAAMRNAVLVTEEAEQVVDAILALPDPVHEAARRLLDVAAVVGVGPSEFAALRAALNNTEEAR